MMHLGTRLLLTAVVALGTLGTASGSANFTQVPGTVSYIKGENAIFNWTFNFEDSIEVDYMDWFKVSESQEYIQIMRFTAQNPLFPSGSLDVRPLYKGRVELVGQAGLKLINLSETDAGLYKMDVFFSDKTKIEGQANLDVKYAPVDTVIDVPPKFQTSTGNAEAREGEDLALGCITRSNPASRFSWTKDHSQLPTTAEVNQTTGALTIKHVQEQYSGTYRCTASNDIPPEGTAAINVYILVHYPPTMASALITSPQGIITVGDYLTLTCNCDYAVPQPKLLWTKVGLTTALSNVADINEELGLLTIRNVQMKDSGVYICVADNGIQPSPSANVTVNVKARPTAKPSLNNNRDGDNNTIIVTTTVSAFALIVLVSIFLYCRQRRSRNQQEAVLKSSEELTPLEDLPDDNTQVGHYKEHSMLLERLSDDERSKIGDVLIDNDYISLEGNLGEGNFGNVRLGVYKKGRISMECAVKTLKETQDLDAMVSLLQEGLRMIDFTHDNVLTLTGICVHDSQAMIVLPYMKHGDLRTYLDNNQTLPPLENLRLCLDIARGMEYLSGKDIVHRDLAARNCMLDENFRVKVADFGLCRDIHEKGYYRILTQAVLPPRSLAPESFDMYIFNTKTDIWSYGIILWEIFATPQEPYPDVPIECLGEKLKQGYRMERPDRCPIMLYESVMKQCWLANPMERPDFTKVLRNVKEIHDQFNY